MKKKIIFVATIVLILIAILIIIFIKKNNKDIQINVEELALKIAETNSFEDELIKVDYEMILKDYNFNKDEIKELVSYQGSGATSEEIVILEVTDKSNLNSVKSKIETRLQERKEAFQSYLPKEVGKIDNKILKVQGNYIILCISNDSQTINGLLNEYLK